MPNMFKCTLASGGALILTVTCDSAFAGQTITCTDGTTTLTQICPSTSPYTVEFRIPNGGTWTISSGTDSTSVVIPDAIELHYIPNGSTITPTDDIQTWLYCAEIYDKTYTTISQVLADASTLQALIASNNAVDYMARSTTWASDVTANQSAMTYIGLNDYCANSLLANSTWLNAICNSSYFESILNVKVPTMTSNTSPSGTASASSVYSEAASGGTTFPAYKAFDNTLANSYDCWHSTVGGMPNAWLRYDFTSAIAVRKVYLRNRDYQGNAASCPLTFTIQGSNNGSTWTNVTGVLTNSQTSAKAISTYNFTNATKYSKYRILIITAAQSNYVTIGNLQFYGRA